MKICYIAHPISGNVENNLSDLRRIIRKINLEFTDIVPFVPYYADIVSLNDNIRAERERGIKNDTAILQSGIVTELWLTGDRLSHGMKSEQEIAINSNIPVVDLIGVL